MILKSPLDHREWEGSPLYLSHKTIFKGLFSVQLMEMALVFDPYGDLRNKEREGNNLISILVERAPL